MQQHRSTRAINRIKAVRIKKTNKQRNYHIRKSSRHFRVGKEIRKRKKNLDNIHGLWVDIQTSEGRA
jgi:hypothetical protein